MKGAFAGELINPRGCYICKNDYTLVDAFYHWLCPSCAAMSHLKRDQRADLSGKRALLTGGRAKIGMYIALRLLGYPRVRTYVGSWKEWGDREDLPVEIPKAHARARSL